MSEIRSSNASRAALAVWRDRGKDARKRGRKPRPPIYKDAAAAYMNGYGR
jgi:hypothetical protein